MGAIRQKTAPKRANSSPISTINTKTLRNSESPHKKADVPQRVKPQAKAESESRLKWLFLTIATHGVRRSKNRMRPTRIVAPDSAC
jgi:hypothetical protein